MAQYGYVIDMNNCYGCKTCAVACKSEKQTAPGVLLRRVYEFSRTRPNELAFMSMSCNHCDQPKCVEVCPVGAYTKREDGIVIQDHSLCIGCRLCVRSCPYGNPQFDRIELKTSKCDFCVGRLEEGLLPYCVQSCPGGVLKFGQIEELRAEYGDQVEVVEQKYKLPSHKITKPNVVIIPAH